MSRLIYVPIGEIKPNPYRDLEVFPFVEAKVQALMESIEAEGLWEGVIVRTADEAGYEAAFGHHRLEAARRLDVDSVNVIVRDLTDEQMVRMMERENAEEGWGFYYTTVQAVRSAVLAYGAGKIELPSVPKEGRPAVRIAPSFLLHHGEFSATMRSTSKAYTAQILADWLGIGVDKVQDALSLLEAVEVGDLSVGALADPLVTRAAATLAVRAAKAASTVKEETLEAERNVHTEARKMAEKEGNKPKVAAQTRIIEQLTEKLKTEPGEAAKRAADNVIKRVKSEEHTAVIARELKESLLADKKRDVGRAVKDAKKAVCPLTAEELDALSRKLDKLLTESERDRVLACHSKVAIRSFRLSLANLLRRGRLLASKLPKDK